MGKHAAAAYLWRMRDHRGLSRVEVAEYMVSALPSLTLRDKPKTHDGEDISDEQDELVPVTDETYFLRKKRSCRCCGSHLWQYKRTEERERATHRPTFAQWSRIVQNLPPHPDTAPRKEKALATLDAEGNWTWTSDERINPYDWMHRHFRGAWGAAFIDESHNGRGTASDIARVFHLLWT